MKMKWEDHPFNQGVGRARGLGAAGSSATHHWIHQRVTAVANVFLTIWFIIWALSVLEKVCTVSRETVSATTPVHDIITASLSSGMNPIFIILFVGSIFYHAKLGLQVVIEDYIHHEGVKIASLLTLKLIIILLSTTCFFSILKITL